MKAIKSVIASLVLSISGIASAMDALPVVFQVEVNGHFFDGIHHILKITKENDSYSIHEAKGSYSWTDGNLNYTQDLLESGLACEFAAEAAQIVCSKNEMYVDGALVVYTFTREANGYDVIKTITTRSWTTGELETQTETILSNGQQILN